MKGIQKERGIAMQNHLMPFDVSKIADAVTETLILYLDIDNQRLSKLTGETLLSNEFRGLLYYLHYKLGKEGLNELIYVIACNIWMELNRPDYMNSIRNLLKEELMDEHGSFDKV